MKRYELVDIHIENTGFVLLFCTDKETLDWITAKIHEIHPKAKLRLDNSLLVVTIESGLWGNAHPKPLMLTLIEELCHRGWEPDITEWAITPTVRESYITHCSLKYTHEQSKDSP